MSINAILFPQVLLIILLFPQVLLIILLLSTNEHEMAKALEEGVLFAWDIGA